MVQSRAQTFNDATKNATPSTVVKTEPGSRLRDIWFTLCCTQSISLPALMQEWGSGKHPDVVAAGASVLVRRISRLSELLRAGQVAVQVRR